jgi:hypothetical protein
MSRREFLAGAAAAGIAAVGARNGVFGALQEHRESLVWVHAYLTQGEGNTWIVTCKGKGNRCAVLRLVKAKKLSPFHDAGLAQCTDAINTILDEIIAKNRVPTRHPHFLVTPYAPFLAWTRETPDAIDERGITLEADPARFYQGLGTSVESYREKPARFWYCIGGSKIACKKGGDTQLAGRLLNADRLSGIHDAELKGYTDRLNSVFDRYAKGNRNPGQNLSLLVTPKGLFLAWSGDDDSEGQIPRGAITALHDEEQILQALGI